MLFSYYFDSDKNHKLNCRFQVLQFAERAAGVIEIMFAAEITETKNGTRLKRETQVATFTFPPTPEGETKHDIDFTRVRYGDEKKWIFTVINNKDNKQKATVGLISETANKNPLGMDIYHDDEEFNVELKANNLAIIEQGYQPPVLTQTLFSNTFAQAGYPERFGSSSASYDGTFQNYLLSDFSQGFLEPIPVGAPFKLEMDLAPADVQPYKESRIFDLNIPKLGRISLLSIGLEYMIENGMADNVSRELFEIPATPEDFWNQGMKAKARMTITGDGLGTLSVKYGGATLTGVYDASVRFSDITFAGKTVRIDNMAGNYQK